MVRKLAAALLGVGVFIPGLANALGLGEIKLNSALSEPLDAEIELVQVRELTATEILPNLATNSDFDSAGVERSQFLSDLKFEVAVNEKGKSFIRVRSSKPVKEPFLNFLVEVNWPAGRLLREYTLFLDPPVYSAQRTQAPAPAKAAAPAPASRPAPKPAAKAPAPSYSPAPEAAAEPAAETGGGTSHTIGANDSLWAIAQELKPSSDVSIHQTMIALQRVNPNAFINDNINLMKKGQVLRAPTVEEAQQVSSREAIELVAEQNRLWREKLTARKGAAPASEAPQMDLTGRSLDREPEQAPPSDEGRLKLLSGAGADSESGKGGSAETGGGELRNKLAVAEENVDKFKLENEDLKVKMSDLSDQLKTSEKVLTLKDQQIAALQAKLEEMEAKTKQAAAAPAEKPVTEPKAEAKPEAIIPEPEAVAPISAEIEEPAPAVAEPAQPEVDFNYQEEKAAAEPETQAAPETAAAPETVAPDAAVPETTAAEATAAEATAPETTEPVAEDIPPAEEPAIVMDEQPVVVEQPAAVESAPAPQPEPVASPDLLTQLISNPLYLGIGAGAIVLLLAVGLLGMRRKKSEDEFDNALVEDFQMPESASSDLADEAEMDFEDSAQALEDIAEPVREETVPQTADVIGEADIYIAYGRYPQAIEMLQKASAKEPGRADIHLKLCEVCVDAKEPQTFMAHYNALQELGDANALRRAEDLRSRIAPAAGAAVAAMPFAAPGDETLIAQPDEEAAFDFDIGDSAPADDIVADLEQEADTGLDFDLGDLEDTGARFAEAAPEVKPQDLSSGLDFDLDLDLQPSEAAAPAAERHDNSLDFDFDIAESAPSVQEAPVVQADDNALDFDAEFSLDSIDETASAASTMSFDEDLSLDFDRVETAKTSAPVAEDNSMDFDLDFDTGTAATVEPASQLDEDHTIAFTPSAPTLEFAPSSDEPMLDSRSAAQLADELDLGGDFLSHDDDATIQAPAFDASPVIAPAVSAPSTPAPQFAANDMTDSGDELDFLSDADETSTKLDLARAYIDMGDRDGAKDILDEVMIEGSDTQKQEAKELLNRLEA